MSVANLQQNIPNRQFVIYNCLMQNYDADAFAEWLTTAFSESRFKSFSALADEVGLSRSSVSSWASAKKQSLTDKPSQPKPENVVALAQALSKNVDVALILAGHAPIRNSSGTHQIEGVKIIFDEMKVPRSEQDRIIQVIRVLTADMNQQVIPVQDTNDFVEKASDRGIMTPQLIPAQKPTGDKLNFGGSKKKKVNQAKEDALQKDMDKAEREQSGD